MKRLVSALAEFVGAVLDAPLSTGTGSSKVRPASITYYVTEE